MPIPERESTVVGDKKVGEVKIFAQTYTLHDCDEATLHNRPLHGMIDYQTKDIYVCRNKNDIQRRDTLLHELLHAMSCEFGVDLKERQVAMLATALLDTMARNPKIKAKVFG